MIRQKNLLLTGIASILLAAGSATSQADVILRINIADPANVTFTATSAFAENDDSETSLYYGFTLIGFLSSAPENQISTSFASSTLAAPGGLLANMTSLSLTWLSGPSIDLNIYADDSGLESTPLAFSTGSIALSGSATIDLSPWAAYLKLGTGDIHSGDGIGGGNGPVIGQYEVVPEPSALLLLTGAGSLLAFARRRFRSQ